MGLVITRNTGFTYLYKRFAIYLNGKKVASVQFGESIKLPLNPGRYKIQAGVSFYRSRPVEFTIEPGKDVHFEIRIEPYRYSFWGITSLTYSLHRKIKIVPSGTPDWPQYLERPAEVATQTWVLGVRLLACLFILYSGILSFESGDGVIRLFFGLILLYNQFAFYVYKLLKKKRPDFHYHPMTFGFDLALYLVFDGFFLGNILSPIFYYMLATVYAFIALWEYSRHKAMSFKKQ